MLRLQDNGGLTVGGSSQAGTNGRILDAFQGLLKGWIWGKKERRKLRILDLILEILEMKFSTYSL